MGSRLVIDKVETFSVDLSVEEDEEIKVDDFGYIEESRSISFSESSEHPE